MAMSDNPETYGLLDAGTLRRAGRVEVEKAADLVMVAWPGLGIGASIRSCVKFEIDRGHRLGWVYFADKTAPDKGDSPDLVLDFTCRRSFDLRIPRDWNRHSGTDFAE
jgi:hypothetical protein